MNLEKMISYVKEKGRKLDYYLLLNLISNESYDEEIINELIEFQNDDGGFGHGLEPDAQTPSSSVLACDVAVEILDEIDDENPRKIKIQKQLVDFYISQYDQKSKSFHFVSKDIEEFPCALWWTGEVEQNFGYFNPNPEVIGFLYKNRQYIVDFDIDSLVDDMIERIQNDFPKTDKEHSLFSVIKFYEKIDLTRQQIIEKVIIDKTRELISTDKEEWKNYSTQPYKLITSKKHPLYVEYRDVLIDNFDFLTQSIDENSVWMPDWSWGQYEELFSKDIRYQWMGFLTFQRLKVLLEFGYIN